MPKIEALAKYLEVDPSDITEDCYGSFSEGGAEYVVLTDSEADAETENYIADSLWAFRASFLAAHSDADEEVFALLQKDGRLCESLNKPFRSLIRDWDRFVQDAIKADGRGHFLAHYDGEEIELGGNLFAYRVN